jgi:hypothetical protein
MKTVPLVLAFQASLTPCPEGALSGYCDVVSHFCHSPSGLAQLGRCRVPSVGKEIVQRVAHCRIRLKGKASGAERHMPRSRGMEFVAAFDGAWKQMTVMKGQGTVPCRRQARSMPRDYDSWHG